MSEVDLEKGELNIKYVLLILVAIISYVAWFYSAVVIPIKEIQLGLAQVQNQLANHDDKEEALKKDIIVLDKRITTNDGRLNQIERVLKLK